MRYDFKGFKVNDFKFDCPTIEKDGKLLIYTSHSQAHLQFAQANTQTKNCKRACLSATAFLPTLKTNFFGNSSASIERISGL
jgi:hypothetical protein